MSNYRKHIDNFFKEKLGKYRETPPPDVWEALESRLDGLAPAPVTPPYRWLIHSAIISSILMLGVYVGVQKMNSTTNNTDSSVQTIAAVRNQANSTHQTTVTNTITAQQQPTSSANSTTPGIATNEETPSTNNTSTIYKKGAEQLAAITPKRNKINHITRNHDKKATPVTVKDTYQYAASHQKSATNPSSEDETESIINAASPNTTLSVVSKPSTVPAGTKNESTNTPSAAVAKNNNSKHKPIFPRFEAGVKMGYEGGFSNDAAQKAVVAPYLQYNLSPKFSILTQPAIKIASVRERQIGSAETYYSANTEDGKVTPGAVINKTRIDGTIVYPEYWSVYTYTQKHDSIVKTNKIGGTSMQFELPVLVQYKIGKKTGVYGGVNVTYSKLTTIRENTYTQKDIVRSYNDTVITATIPAPVPSMGIEYTGKDIDSYNGPMRPAQSGSQLGVGYMVGVNYQLSKKIIVDALIQQTPSKADYKGGYNINAPLSAPYFRLSIGYKITK